MKYELEPDNRNCSDEVLLKDLKAVAARLGRHTLSKAEYDEYGRFSSATIRNRLGSWNGALEQAGLSTDKKRRYIPETELLNDLKAAAETLGTDELSITAYKQVGNFSNSTVARVFGSWEKAVLKVGLKVSGQYHHKISDEELLSNMASVWEAVGRQPRQGDFQAPLSKYAHDAYVRRYGSWRKALEKFVEVAGSGEVLVPAANEPPVVVDSVVAACRNKTSREPSWRLWFLVNRRDRFTCRACGRSPATHPGVVLHVDHIIAWSKGGETILENLQTLCMECNIGKSNLEMENNRG